jgi:hypothetical protein
MLFKEHQVQFHLEEYNTIWTCSNCSPVKCGKSEIVSFTTGTDILNGNYNVRLQFIVLSVTVVYGIPSYRHDSLTHSFCR